MAYLKLAVQFVLIPLVTLPILIGQIANARARSVGIMILMTFHFGLVTLLIWAATRNVPDSAPFRWLTAAMVLAVLMFAIGMSLYSLRKLLRRPHPFVEITS